MGTYKIKNRQKKKSLKASEQSDLTQAMQGVSMIVNQVRSVAANILADPDALQTDPAPKPPTGRLRALLVKVVERFTGAAQTPDRPPAWLYGLMSQSFAFSNDIAEQMGLKFWPAKRGAPGAVHWK
jgi:hypothetical protein